MLSSLIKVSEASTLVVSLAALKDWMGVHGTHEDSNLTALLEEAQDVIASETGLSFHSTTWKESYDCFPRAIETMRGPVTSITSLTYYDISNVQQTLTENTDFFAVYPTEKRAVIYPANTNRQWHQTYVRPDAVQLVYVCNPSVPALATRAIKIYCTFAHDGNRGSNDMDRPPEFERLLRLLRTGGYY